MAIGDEVILQLVQNVAGLEAKVESMNVSMGEVKSQVCDLVEFATTAKSFGHAAKALWTLIGLMLGAGGSELIQTLLASLN
jgi:hypothetical protein